jgi:hypothetical protein
MIAWNGLLPRWDGYRLGWHGQKIRFSFLVNCAMSGYQKGLAGWLNAGAEIIRDFPYLETDAQFTFP